MFFPTTFVPVVDLFAGPGGLGEGFASAFVQGRPRFKLALSVECDPYAHQTLTLRAFCREFLAGGRRLPSSYFDHLRGELSHEELFARHPHEANAALNETCFARLGDPADDARIYARLSALRKSGVDFSRGVMIGGPPCQAYSLVGRSRLSRAKASGAYKEESDGRHVLYREYLRLITDLQPAVFVIENVRGILSATYRGERILPKILCDLEHAGYNLHALGHGDQSVLIDAPVDHRNYLLISSDFGVPQRRARVFIIGTRKNLHVPRLQLPMPTARVRLMTVRKAIFDLPKLRSGLSSADSDEAWKNCIRSAAAQLAEESLDSMTDVRELLQEIASPRSRLPTHRAVSSVPSPSSSVGLVVNHETRGHIPDDLARYLFYAAWAAKRGNSPNLQDLPSRLLPNHQNIHAAIRQDSLKQVAFSDRFRVQVAHQPSTTITSHISKDGHGFVHPDPRQCRSLTVREAARLQTFPDDYLFCGPRTEQYKQVGNAVPPLLARQIAELILRANVW